MSREKTTEERFRTSDPGIQFIQSADKDTRENVMPKKIWVNMGKTFEILDNKTQCDNNLLPNIPPQIPKLYTKNPNTSRITNISGIESSTIMPLFQENQYVQPIAYPHQRPDKGIETSSKEDLRREIRKIKRIIEEETRSRGIQSLSYDDLCIHPNIELPPGFKIPRFNTFDGKGNPVTHLKDYCGRLIGIGHNEAILMRLFSQSLSGIALEWYTKQDFKKWCAWEDMAHDFVEQYKFNISSVLFNDLLKIRKRSCESLQEYAIRWRIEASRLHPPLPENELISTFVQIQEGIYFEKMMGICPPDFATLILIAKAIDKGIQSGRIIKTSVQDINQSERTEGHKVRTEQSVSKVSRKRKPRSYTQLIEPMANIFARLQASGIVHPRKEMFDSNHTLFDSTKCCAFHSYDQGHDIEECVAFKDKIQNMIDSDKLRVCQPDEKGDPFAISLNEIPSVMGYPPKRRRFNK